MHIVRIVEEPRPPGRFNLGDAALLRRGDFRRHLLPAGGASDQLEARAAEHDLNDTDVEHSLVRVAIGEGR